MKKVCCSLLVIAILVILCGIYVPQKAHAMTFQYGQANVTCSGSGCDNQDPFATGCAIGSYVAQWVYVSYEPPDNPYIGEVQLWYSPTCGTNWTKIVSYTSYPMELQGVVVGTDGTYCWPSDCSTSILGTILWTNMVYSPALYSAYGYGCIGYFCNQTSNG